MKGQERQHVDEQQVAGKKEENGRNQSIEETGVPITGPAPSLSCAMSRRGFRRTAEWVWEKCASDTAMLLAVPLACAAVIWDAATTTEIADSDQSASCRYPPARHIFGADQVRQLERNGFVVVVMTVPAAPETCPLTH